MKKRLNTVFFSICFLAALIAEAYCIIALKGEPISAAGMGIVALIMGYLLLDTIRGQWKQGGEKVKFYLEQIYREEAEKWNDRYTEMLNLQKASYAATKKRELRTDEKYEELLLRLSTLEKNHTASLQKIAELQKKLMDGQKNALNIEVNYNKENTKLLINALREELGKLNQEEKLSLILTAVQQGGTGILKEDTEEAVLKEEEQDSGLIDWRKEETEEGSEKFTAPEETEQEEAQAAEETLDIEMSQEEAAPAITPLYDDPNKALTADEIAALFASFGK